MISSASSGTSVSHINQNLQENLTGIQVVQLSNREEHNLKRFNRINRRNRRHELHATTLSSAYQGSLDSITGFGLVVIIWFGGGNAIQGSITVGTLILFTQYVNMLLRPVNTLGIQYRALFQAAASCERIFWALDWKEKSIQEPEQPYELPAIVRGEIEFRDLTFGYDPEKPVLKQVSLTIRAGEKLAVVGPTGSGKTTLIRLLGRFYEVPEGSIFLDGIDVNRIHTSDLRKRAGVVLQNFHIFSGSVLENIRLGNPEISREDTIEVAKLVNADDFIRALPQGYDTPLGERGQRLSRGQQQLLAFARVFAMDPEIFILDEATSSIDSETERLVQKAFKTVTRGRTCILIAHRLQTIQDADRILVLENGQMKSWVPTTN